MSNQPQSVSEKLRVLEEEREFFSDAPSIIPDLTFAQIRGDDYRQLAIEAVAMYKEATGFLADSMNKTASLEQQLAARDELLGETFKFLEDANLNIWELRELRPLCAQYQSLKNGG